MFGKEKCKMLKEIRAEIARNNDIHLVIEECTHQGKCKGTCPACEAEVAYLEEQLEKRKALGKAVCVAGISAAMVTGVVQGQQMKNSRSISGVQGVYQQGPEMDKTMGVVWETENPEITETPELPMGTMAPPETTPPAVTAEPTPTSDFYTEEPTVSPEVVEGPESTPTMGVIPLPSTMPPIVTAEPTPTSDFCTDEPTPTPVMEDTCEPTGSPMVTDTPHPRKSPTTIPTPTPKMPMGTMAPPKTTPPVVTAELTSTSDFYTNGPTTTGNPQMKVENQEIAAGANQTPLPETEYYVTFVYNDGTIEQVVQSYRKKEALGDMPVLTRKGYSFGGWYTTATGGNKVSAKDMVVQHTKLYAHWNKVRVKQTRITSVKRAGKNRIHITWSKSSGVAGYRVVVATDRDLTQKIKILYVSKDQKKVTVPGIEGKTRYYISVVGYRKDSTDSKVYGKCQKIKKIIG